MNVEVLREYILGFPYVSESFPFDQSTLVFKVFDKVFALIALEHPEGYVLLKADPDRALELRDRYEGVEPGFHMNKKHWNGVYLRRDVPQQLIKELVQHSYDLVFQKLPKAKRDILLHGQL